MISSPIYLTRACSAERGADLVAQFVELPAPIVGADEVGFSLGALLPETGNARKPFGSERISSREPCRF